MVKNFVALILALPFLAGCSAPTNINIPSISKDHPANKFY